jgi:hypothetical protein
MPTFNFDEQAKRIEPIKFKWKDEDFEITSVSPQAFDEVRHLQKDYVDDEIGMDECVSRQLHLLTGEPQDKFVGIDARLSGPMVDQLIEAVLEVHRKRQDRKKPRR